MMKLVELKLKAIVSSVTQDPEDLSKLSDKVLRCLNNPKDDSRTSMNPFFFKVKYELDRNYKF